MDIATCVVRAAKGSGSTYCVRETAGQGPCVLRVRHTAASLPRAACCNVAWEASVRDTLLAVRQSMYGPSLGSVLWLRPYPPVCLSTSTLTKGVRTAV